MDETKEPIKKATIAFGDKEISEHTVIKCTPIEVIQLKGYTFELLNADGSPVPWDEAKKIVEEAIDEVMEQRPKP